MDLKDVKPLWEQYGYRPDKRLGQNFLSDKNVRDNIVDALLLDRDTTVIEIGPGFGVMTFDIAKKCKELYAVEKDERISDIMESVFEQAGNIKLTRGDILATDIMRFVPSNGKILVFGNIPYYITTPIIEKIIENRKSISRAYLLTQDEFASRIVSPPGSKQYGSISCFVQFYTKAKKVFKVSKNCFYPRPQVDSALLSLEILQESPVKVKDEDLMFAIIRKSFTQRRKKISNTLPHGEFLGIEKGRWNEILETAGVDAGARPEVLSLQDYARICDVVHEGKYNFNI
ncbi:MAG TPA: 16S rRNA (adenine(1518)-N(6)/adenine(1519)-N(6))-dimethyltransferase RsmA [Candidatus Omnitrophota bacterium]|nr:16S rRNA (adenine(1518)-N(6)/adenine(1519)-N(6))-dimethyltransferase RsmA [Candidatus Omnitrophota bacterium]HPS19923.1 16S rRNA (adenine(1518)-N(6)/adenine(1519)-N(6))-dimethyltransferase RsmA [Candidatus Omnitrophota bacterium]